MSVIRYYGISRLFYFEYVGGRPWGGDDYFLVAYGVDECEAVGVERDTAVGIGTRVTVFEVAADGAAYMCQLAAYLVVAACVEMNFEQVVAAFRGGEQLVVENCLLGVCRDRRNYKRFVFLFVA